MQGTNLPVKLVCENEFGFGSYEILRGEKNLKIVLSQILKDTESLVAFLLQSHGIVL
jgi:hypothetical protein